MRPRFLSQKMLQKEPLKKMPSTQPQATSRVANEVSLWIAAQHTQTLRERLPLLIPVGIHITVGEQLPLLMVLGKKKLLAAAATVLTTVMTCHSLVRCCVTSDAVDGNTADVIPRERLPLAGSCVAIQ